eukprot:63548-Hanusia_phi.AAC.1
MRQDDAAAAASAGGAAGGRSRRRGAAAVHAAEEDQRDLGGGASGGRARRGGGGDGGVPDQAGEQEECEDAAAEDQGLQEVTHIFVDEIHERDINSDFLLVILKRLLSSRPSLKLVLMSATLNAPLFASFFSSCPVVSIPGRAHPVQALFLEDALELTGYVLDENSEFARKPGGDRSKGGGGGGGRGGGGPGRGGGGGPGRGRGGGPGRGGGGGGGKVMPKGREEEENKDDVSWWRRKLVGYSEQTYLNLTRVEEETINYELIVLLVEKLCEQEDEEGAILIFLPGLAEITRLYEELTARREQLGSGWVIYPLHSSLSSEEQRAVFERGGRGRRKVIVGTNIAETSITIDDVTMVIDSCRMKENRWDAQRNISSLQEDFVSKASARQRRGRAGRVKPGVCYHLVSSFKFNSFKEYQVPEMLRVPLDSIILQIKLLGLGSPSSFLAQALEPPKPEAIDSSLELLRRIGALRDKGKEEEGREQQEEQEEQELEGLTALGRHLAALPVDVRIGKMLLYGAILGCCEPVLTMAAAMGFRSPFMSPMEKREEADKKRREMGLLHSDHLTTLRAYEGWRSCKLRGRREAQR